MEYQAYESKLSKLSARFNLMVSLVFFLMVSNSLLAGLCWYTSIHQKTEVTPFSGNNSYLKSASDVDGHYLSLMSENFIYSRLNVTPETVDANHKRLLSFVNAENFSEMLKLLQKEANLIKNKKISSVFHIAQIRSNPANLTVNVTGILKRHVGLRDLKDEKTTYQIQYQYRFGRLSIVRFTQMKELKNV